MANYLNAQMPRVTDPHTRIDSVKAIPEDTLEYFATLSNICKAPACLDSIKRVMEPAMLNLMKGSLEFMPYKQDKVSLVYTYFGDDKTFLFRILITPDKYLN